MIKTFVRQSSIYLVSNGITKVIGLAFFAYISRVLSKEQMGAYGLLNNVVTVLTLLMTLQIHQGYMRYYLDVPPADRRSFEFSTGNALLIANVVLGFVAFLLRPLIEWLSVPMDTALLVVLLCLPFSTAVVALFGNKLRLQNRALTAGIQSVLLLLVYVGGTYTLLKLKVEPLLAVFGGLLLQNTAGVIWYILDVGTWRFTLHWTSISRTVRFSALIVPGALGLYLTLLTGKFVMKPQLGVGYVGIYEATSRVAMIIQTIMQPLLQATGPIVYGQYRQADFPPRYYKLLHIHMVALAGLVVGFSLLTPEVVHLVVGPQYLDYAYLVFPFAMAAVFMHMTDFFVNNVHLSQKTQYITVIEIVTGVVSAAASYGLILKFGFTGAIIALVLSYGLRCTMYICFANGLYPQLKISYSLILGYLGGCGLLLLANYLLRNLPLPARLLLAFAECAALTLAFMRYYRVHPRQLLSLLRP